MGMKISYTYSCHKCNQHMSQAELDAQDVLPICPKCGDDMTQYRVNPNYGQHYKHYSSAIATVRACNYCKHTERVECGRPGVGRGHGMREGNKARGRMIQHLIAEHPEKLKGD